MRVSSISRTNIYAFSSPGGRNGGFGLAAIWFTELVNILSREININDTSRTLSPNYVS